jgi:fumarylacetoacetase
MEYIEANDPKWKSWIEVPQGSDFPIQNLPFGVFSVGQSTPRCGVAIGEYVVDLSALAELGYLDHLPIADNTVFFEPYLNEFMSCDKEAWRAVRQRVSELLRSENPQLRDNQEDRDYVLFPMSKVTLHMPVQIGDYTDFYSSISHASHVGAMFRDPQNPLLPNWRHIPVGYHGRASSIVLSGTKIHRPKGQIKPNDSESPIFSPTKELDFELELAFITGKATPLGSSISTEEAEEHIFGFVLFNDWSARDIQRWEYVPLGPFLSKSFASSISPWIVTKDALEPFRVAGPVQEPKVLPYLEVNGLKNFDIQLEVTLKTEEGQEAMICKTNFSTMYWNCNQQLAHQTINGCNINVGDLYASGTISGEEQGSMGCLLESTKGAKEPVKIAEGVNRTYIQDNDSITIKGFAMKNGIKIGFGEVCNQVLPSK